MSSKKLVIGVNGHIGSGKTEFSNIACNEYGFNRVSFAGALKQEVRDFLIKYDIPFEDRNLYGTQADKEEPCIFGSSIGDIIEEHSWLAGECRSLTFRKLLQLWGTEYRRMQDGENYWVERAFIESTKYDKVAIDDVRFFNEYSALRLIGATTIRIERPDSFLSGTGMHSSETALDHIRNWNYKIINSSTIDSFRESCRYILNEICKG